MSKSNIDTDVNDIDDDILEIEESSSGEQDENLEDLIPQLIKICEDEKIKYEHVKNEYLSGLKIFIPSGRDTRAIIISKHKHAKALIESEFNLVRFIDRYEGIISPDNGEAEFLLDVRMTIRFDKMIEDHGGVINLTPDNPSFPKLCIAPASDLSKALFKRYRAWSLQIQETESYEINSSNDAEIILEKFGSSLFYQIDQVYGVSISAARERTRLKRIAKSGAERTRLTYPAYEYDSAPLALYRYARSAKGMPLLQFLAYYQVVEYFFPCIPSPRLREE